MPPTLIRRIPGTRRPSPALVDDEREWVLVDGENILGRDEGVAHPGLTACGVSRHHARVMLRKRARDD